MTNVIVAILTVAGGFIANALLVIFWFDGKVETNNLKVDNAVIQNTARVDSMVSENSKRFGEIYRIIVNQEGRIINNTSDIDEINRLLKILADEINKEE
ncbi:MAG: hypothetical protein OXF24_06985 [Hyphomicrobiales bacterium]|nr:hypothetical protein [Hyphomicrobiales bacterium]